MLFLWSATFNPPVEPSRDPHAGCSVIDRRLNQSVLLPDAASHCRMLSWEALWSRPAVWCYATPSAISYLWKVLQTTRLRVSPSFSSVLFYCSLAGMTCWQRKAFTSTWGGGLGRISNRVKWETSVCPCTRQCFSTRGVGELPGKLLKPTNAQEPSNMRQIRNSGVGAAQLIAFGFSPIRKQRPSIFQSSTFQTSMCT